MGSYIANFTVYTMAMTGLIFFAIFVYKKVMNGDFCSDKSKFLSIEDSMNINPRKSLLVVRAGKERFLIASDIDKTTLISKLEDSSVPKAAKNFQELIDPKNFPANRVIDIKKQEPVVLEPVREKNPNSPRNYNYMENNKPFKKTYEKQVVLDFEEHSNNKNLTTMKEMAKRINEL